MIVGWSAPAAIRRPARKTSLATLEVVAHVGKTRILRMTEVIPEGDVILRITSQVCRIRVNESP